MMKKLVIIGMFLLILAPFQSAIGVYQNITIDENNQIYYTNIESNIETMINQINHSILYGYLEKIVSFGIRFVGTENCRKAMEFINDEFRNLGLDSYIDEWKYSKYKCQNVIGTLNGTDSTSDAVFVLTAHLDTTKDSVGANDDGSGVASILTIANITSKYHFNHTIKFVIVSGEEKGTFGSFDYAKKAYNRNENIIANINLDSIGNSTCGNILQARVPERSFKLYCFFQEITEKYQNFIDMKVQLTANTRIDNQAFVDYGYDAISFVQPKFSEYPYHSPKDTLDKITYQYFENVTKLILASTVELAEKEIDVQVRFITPKEGYIYFLNQPILKLPGFNLFRTRLRGMTYLVGRSIARINITTKEEIISIIYSIDGNTEIFNILTKEPYEWKIKKPTIQLFRLKGKHKLGVCVCTITGKTANDEMDFFALTPI
jgi:hypothetical protein